MRELASKIIVDAFGGDNAPLEVIKGCERAVRELGVSIILTGSEEKIKKCAAENGLSLSGIEIVHTDDVFDIHEEPKEIMKSGILQWLWDSTCFQRARAMPLYRQEAREHLSWEPPSSSSVSKASKG